MDPHLRNPLCLILSQTQMGSDCLRRPIVCFLHPQGSHLLGPIDLVEMNMEPVLCWWEGRTWTTFCTFSKVHQRMHLHKEYHRGKSLCSLVFLFAQSPFELCSKQGRCSLPFDLPPIFGFWKHLPGLGSSYCMSLRESFEPDSMLGEELPSLSRSRYLDHWPKP